VSGNDCLNRQGAKIAKFFEEMRKGSFAGENHVWSISAFTLASSAPWRFQQLFLRLIQR
jgi:hypothetical protein